MKESKKSLRGRHLLAAAMNQILKHPETWDQGIPISRKGNRHCIGGWVVRLSGIDLNPLNSSTMEEIETLTGVTRDEAKYLYQPYRTLSELYSAVELYVNYGGFLGDFFDEGNLPYIKVPDQIK